jgi:hypothetical protein
MGFRVWGVECTRLAVPAGRGLGEVQEDCAQVGTGGQRGAPPCACHAPGHLHAGGGMGFGFRVWGLGLGCRVWGLGCRVQI